MSGRTTRKTGPLTDKEKEWVALFVRCLSPKEIADEMHISYWGQRWYKSQVMRKWGVAGRSDVALAWQAVKHGFVRLEVSPGGCSAKDCIVSKDLTASHVEQAASQKE